MADPCPTCRGTGYEIVEAADGVARARECECRRYTRSRSLVRNARIPRRYEDRSFENFSVNSTYPSLIRARDACRAWAERWPDVDGEGLMLVGPPGTGKTHLAVATAIELAEHKGATVAFREQRELLKSLQSTFGQASGPTEAQVLAPVLSADVLVLDDLGAGRTTDWARDELHEIIAHRYNERLPLVLTTNCSIAEDEDSGSGDRGDASGGAARGLTLRQRLGDALLSRLYEMCSIIELKGHDFRRKVLNARISRR